MVCGWRLSRVGRSRRSPAISASVARSCASGFVRRRPTAACGPDLPTSEEREEIKKLRRENHVRRANEILRAASVFFATELDADRPR